MGRSRGYAAHMRILSTIVLALACLVVGCAHPIDSDDEATAEAVGAWNVHNDLTAIKAAIDGGATFSQGNKCIVVGGVNKYATLADGVFGLANTPGFRFNAPVYDRLKVGDIVTTEPGEQQFVLHVPAEVYLENQEQWTEIETWHALSTMNIGGQAYLDLVDP